MGCAVFSLVLVLLAHGLLMTSEAGADAPRGSHVHQAGLSTMDASPGDDSLSEIAPMHPDGCGAAMPVLSSQRPSTSGPGVSDQVPSGVKGVESTVLARVAHPPTSPPAARRALIQVYRI